MEDKIESVLGGILVIVMLMTALWCLFLGIGMAGCWSSWSESGMDYKFTTLGFCKIEVRDGVWVPESRYRAIE